MSLVLVLEVEEVVLEDLEVGGRTGDFLSGKKPARIMSWLFLLAI
jgi:hypothetical protein